MRYIYRGNRIISLEKSIYIYINIVVIIVKIYLYTHTVYNKNDHHCPLLTVRVSTSSSTPPCHMYFLVLVAPQGINPPQLFVVNDTAIRVTWTNPAQPNGQITAYNIYLDGRKIPTGLTTAGSYVLGNLEPYTIYKIQVGIIKQLKGEGPLALHLMTCFNDQPQ